ncbi:MAG: hypothetical protein SPI94_05030 [Candidatus Onthovivens sp.]|nr:hypothetical protein [Candidatus Onthovivens sp.]
MVMSYLDDSKKMFSQVAYNDYSMTRDLPTLIVNYLFNNNQNIWKLLKYSENPLDEKDLTNKEKAEMICQSSFNTEEFNVLFQKYTVDAMIKAKSQIRVFIDDISSYGRTDALVRIIFQVIVNNNEMMITTPYSKNDKRDVAIMQEIVKTLNGVKLEKTKSQIFIDNDVDRFAGAEQVSYNSNYSGFQLTMDVWI